MLCVRHWAGHFQRERHQLYIFVLRYIRCTYLSSKPSEWVLKGLVILQSIRKRHWAMPADCLLCPETSLILKMSLPLIRIFGA